VPDPFGAQGRDDLADLGDPVLAALLADVDRDPEPGRPRLPDERQQVAVGVGPGAVGARAGDVTGTSIRCSCAGVIRDGSSASPASCPAVADAVSVQTARVTLDQ
jgi:hypothetical protein